MLGDSIKVLCCASIIFRMMLLSMPASMRSRSSMRLRAVASLQGVGGEKRFEAEQAGGRSAGAGWGKRIQEGWMGSR